MKNAAKKPLTQPYKDLFDKILSLEKESIGFGFYWENIDQLLDQISSECDEVKEAIRKKDQVNLKEEIGDLIHAALALCVFCKFNMQETLNNSIEKYERRLNALMNAVKEDGHADLKNQPTEVLDKYWRNAKKKVGQPDC